jgi:hypothetical protein
VKPLIVQPLEFEESILLEWKRGHYEMLSKLPESSFLRRILDQKIRNRTRLGRRFFGEALVATSVTHEQGWFGSFKWMSSWPRRSGSEYASEYRAALMSNFPNVSDLPSKSFALRRLLGGKKPVPPDLWLIVNGEHRFIEVKLPGDVLRPTQVAGLALIATCLSEKKTLSVWLYNLYPEGSRPAPISERMLAMYREFCEICRRANKSFQPTRNPRG